MPYGDGGDFQLGFHNCRRWQKLDDLSQILGSMVKVFNFQVLATRSLAPLSFNDSKQGFSEHCHREYETREGKWDENYYYPHADGGLTLRFTVPFIEVSSPPIWDHLLMSSGIWGQEYNQINFSMRLGTRYLSAERIRKYQGDLVNLYSRMARFLIPLLSPDYAFICEDDDKYERFVNANDVRQKAIKQIYWANYFGPEFLRNVSQLLFTTAPVGTFKQFQKGFWYYLHKDFTALTDLRMLKVEQKAMDYFSERCNVEWVQWRFTPA